MRRSNLTLYEMDPNENDQRVSDSTPPNLGLTLLSLMWTHLNFAQYGPDPTRSNVGLTQLITMWTQSTLAYLEANLT